MQPKFSKIKFLDGKKPSHATVPLKPIECIPRTTKGGEVTGITCCWRWVPSSRRCSVRRPRSPRPVWPSRPCHPPGPSSPPPPAYRTHNSELVPSCFPIFYLCRSFKFCWGSYRSESFLKHQIASKKFLGTGIFRQGFFPDLVFMKSFCRHPNNGLNTKKS